MFSIFQAWRIDFKAIYVTSGTERNEVCSFGKGAQSSILCKFKALQVLSALLHGVCTLYTNDQQTDLLQNGCYWRQPLAHPAAATA